MDMGNTKGRRLFFSLVLGSLIWFVGGEGIQAGAGGRFGFGHHYTHHHRRAFSKISANDFFLSHDILRRRFAFGGSTAQQDRETAGGGVAFKKAMILCVYITRWDGVWGVHSGLFLS